MNSDKKLVDILSLNIRQEAEVDSHANGGEQVECFTGGHQCCVCQNSVGAADMVVYFDLLRVHQTQAGVFFVLNHFQNNLLEMFDDFALGFAQRNLVRNLEHMTGGFRPLSPKPAYRKPDFGDRVDDRLNLLGQTETRQMKHHAGAHPGAKIGRTGS